MNPWPAVRFCWKMPTSRASAAPARHAIVLAMRIVMRRVPLTLTPRVSAASGVSPTARIFRPNVVLLIMNQTTGTRANAT